MTTATTATEAQKKSLGLLGLGLRGGLVTIGVDGTRAALQRDRCTLVMVACDASNRTNQKVVRLARARGVPVIAGPVADTLGAALGRPPVTAAGIQDRGLAEALLTLAAPVVESEV